MTEILVVTGPAIPEHGSADDFDAAGHGVSYCAGFGDAYQRVGVGDFDVVVSSTGLEDGDGVQFLHRIGREHSGLGTVAVLERARELNRAQSKDIDATLFRGPPVDTLVSAVEEVRTDVVLRATEGASTDLLWTLSRLGSTLPGADSRAEMERAVCDAFGGSDYCLAAWISRLDAEADRLVPATAAGFDVEMLAPVPDPGVDPGVETRRVGGDPGDRTQVRVPLRSDGSRYGAFSLVTPHTVREEELSLLDHLGRLVSRLLVSDRDRSASDPLTERYTSVLSHELRNQLQIVEPVLSRETKEPEDWEEVESVFERINRLADEAEFVSDRSVDPEALSAGDLKETALAAWNHLPHRDATLTIADSERVVADHDLLTLSFENLFRNSVDHGGRDVDITVGMLGDRDGFFVEDTGPGIPPEERERVFDWGYAIDGGTGFGLAIVDQIAENHGWDVTATESDTGGVRFEVTGVTTP